MSSSNLQGLPPLSLAMIVRDCAADLEVALASIHEHVDEIVIVDTAPEGSKDGTRDVALKYGAKLFDFPWVNDFAKARNFSFSKTSHNLVMWLDSDDEVMMGHQLCEDARLAFAQGLQVMQVRYDYFFDKNGICRQRLLRERFVDKTVNEWRSPIHEVLCATYMVNSGLLPPHLGYIKHRRAITLENRTRNDLRNLEICQEMEKAGTLETRTLYYYAQALRAFERWEEALEMYLRYIPMSGLPPERYSAMVCAAGCNWKLGRTDAAKKMLAAAIVEYPNFPSAYLDMGEIFMMENDHVRAAQWARECIKHQDGIDGENAVDPALLMGRPHLQLAAHLTRESKYKEAIDAVRKAEEYLGDDPDVIKAKDQLVLIESHGASLKAFATLADELRSEGREEDARTLAKLAPASIANSPEVRQLIPKARPKDKPTLAIICPHRWEFWGPESISTGIGGSEEAVIHLSRELVKLGLFHVEVYNYCKQATVTPEGVHWYPTFEFDGSADVAVYWRSPDGPLKTGLEAKRSYLWLHDVPQRDAWIKDFDLLFDRVIVLSDYHRSLYNFVPEEMVWYSKNGLDLSSLPEPKNEPGKIIYSSCPTRGLKYLLKWWRYIKDAVPHATLDCYYGWNAVALEHKKHNIVMEHTYQEVERLKTQPGITWHGRVGQPELHEALSRAQIWAYPTMFPEISPVHGDTVIETLSGPRTIKSLVGQKDFHVYSCHAEGDLSVSKVRGVFKTRINSETVKITYKAGKGRKAKKLETLICTPDHEIMLADGKYARADQLQVGASLKAFHRRANEWGHGYDTIGVTGEAHRWPEHRYVFQHMNRRLEEGEVVDHIDGNTRNNEPANLEAKTQSQHRKDHWERLSPDARQAAIDSRIAELERWHASLSEKELAQAKRDAANARWDKRLSNHRVVKVERAEKADVYCMEVEPDHNFVANGIFVHNCITAMKAQAMGAMPIVNNFAALKETVQFGWRPELDLEKVPDQKKFAEAVIDALKNPTAFTDREEMVRWSRQTYSWAAIAKQWQDQIVGDLSSTDAPRRIERGRIPRRSPALSI